MVGSHLTTPGFKGYGCIIQYTGLRASTIENIEKMIQYTGGLDPQKLTSAQVTANQVKSEEFLNSYDFSRVDTTKVSDVAPLLIASALGYMDFLEKWQAHGLSFDVADSNGNTPLHYVAVNPWCRRNLLPTLQFLLKSGGLDPNAVSGYTGNGFTPLFRLIAGDAYNSKINDLEYTTDMVEELMDSGADVNRAHDDGTTSFRYVLSRYDKVHYKLIGILLNLGADINVLSEKPSPYRRSFTDELEVEIAIWGERDRAYFDKLIQIRRDIVCHVTRLNVLGLPVSERVNSECGKMLRSRNNDMNVSRVANEKFKKECQLEIERMKSVKLDGVNSMYDLALKSEAELREFTYKQVFQDYFSSKQYREDFPIYWFILRLQFNAAERRIRRLLPDARVILKSFNWPLYDLCLDSILKYFTNEELCGFIEDHAHEVGSAGKPDSSYFSLVQNKLDRRGK